MPGLIDKDFIVNVGRNCTFTQTGDYQTLPEDVDEIFEKFERDNVSNITLFFHGGLVNESRGLQTARNIAPHFQSAGTSPICIVWETGLIETIATNLTKISDTRLFNKLLKLLLKRAIEELGFSEPGSRGTGAANISYSDIEKELSSPDPFGTYGWNSTSAQSRSATTLDALSAKRLYLQQELRRKIEADIERDPEFQASIQATKLTVDAEGDRTGSRGIITVASLIGHATKVVLRIIDRFIEKRDHDLYPTVVEEILREFYLAELGAWVWKAMKDKSAQMWESNQGRTGNTQYVGRYLLDKLAAYKQRFPQTRINLIGHSAGSIAICHLLSRTATLPNSFTFEHLILLAPACRIDLFQREIVTNPTRFKDIRIFTMSDSYECNDILVPYLYTHSLLYLISGVLEDEGASFDAYILGLERHIKFIKPYDIQELEGTHKFLATSGLNRCCFSVSASGSAAGLESHSLKHGDFDEDPGTIRSIQNILRN